MTIDDLKKIEAAATPADWVLASEFPHVTGYRIKGGSLAFRKGPRIIAYVINQDTAPLGSNNASGDARLIPAARNHFAALLKVADVLNHTPFPSEVDNPKDGSGRIQLTVSMNVWHDWIDARQKALQELEAIR
mgnify:CR=1 FL=1